MKRYFRVGKDGLWYAGSKHTTAAKFNITRVKACKQMAEELGVASITAFDLKDDAADPRSGDWAEVPVPATPTPPPERTIEELANSTDELTAEESARLIRATAKAAGL